MISSEILLYPDTGPEFLRSLKMAVLYTRRVHVLTILDQDLVESYAAQLPAQPTARAAPKRPGVGDSVPIGGGGVPAPSTQRVSDYLSFIKRNREDLDLLVAEGLLTSDFPTVYGFGGTFHSDSNVRRACERWPPSYWDFLGSSMLDTSQRLASFQGHLCFIASVAQRIGVPLATWSLDFQTALWTSVAQLAEGGPISSDQGDQSITDIEKRRHIETALARSVLERYVPRVDNLPFSTIIDLRRKCAPELERFSNGIGQVASEVDVTQPRQKMDLQLRDVVARHIDPAIQALEASMALAKLDLFKNLASKDSLIGGVGFTIAALSRAPYDIAAAIGLGAATVSSLAGAAFDGRKALRASNWAILFRLNRLLRKQDQQSKRHDGPLSIIPK